MKTHALKILTPAPWLMPVLNRGVMQNAVEDGILAHYRAHPQAVESLPEPFRSRTLAKLNPPTP